MLILDIEQHKIRNGLPNKDKVYVKHFVDDSMLLTKVTNLLSNENLMCWVSVNGSMKKRWVFRGMPSIVHCEIFHGFSNLLASALNMSHSNVNKETHLNPSGLHLNYKETYVVGGNINTS